MKKYHYSMEKRKKIKILVVLFGAVLIGFTSINMYREKTVAYHLIEKDENALYRLKTITLEEISDPFKSSFIESEIAHIEHGILILTPFDILFFIIWVLAFGYFCHALGATY
jgi:hypothetical protein